MIFKDKKPIIKAGVVVFPGTNCDKDTMIAITNIGWKGEYLWHFTEKIGDFDVIFLPGGFSYGDYIRSGRLAKFSPVMQAVSEFIERKKGFVVGICNGFQILCECKLLPGVLTDNVNTYFICKTVELELEGKKTIKLPIAHGEGRFLKGENFDEKLVFLKYKHNPNGSDDDIAGLYDRERKIIGMMPHPERACSKAMGNTDGEEIFRIIERDLAL